MKTLRHIFVAIKQPRDRRQPALRKAKQLAAASGARLALYHALTNPVALDSAELDDKTPDQLQKEWRQRALAQLEKLAAPLRREGIKVTVHCDWDFPAYEAVIRRARRLGADLIVAERHAKQHLLPTLLRFNDWELLRRSPLPVLLVKRGGSWQHPAVLAAIDPSHGMAKPTKLDDSILQAASLVSGALQGELHVAHAWKDAPLVAVPTAIPLDLYSCGRRTAREAFDAAIAKSGLKRVKRHLVEGYPVEVIRKLARSERAGIVVMGAVSRSGLKRLVIGNVAEQVLDSLPCDVLVVKPKAFKARVGANRRGMQVVATRPFI